MKKYRVSFAVKVPTSWEAEVEAQDEQKAVEKAYDAYNHREWESVGG